MSERNARPRPAAIWSVGAGLPPDARTLVATGALVLGSALAAMALSLLFQPLVRPNPFIFFFAAVALSAWHGGIRLGLSAALIGSLLAHYVVIPTIGASDSDLLLRLALFVGVSGLMSWLSEARLRAEARARAYARRLEASQTSAGAAEIRAARAIEQINRLQDVTSSLAGDLTPADVAATVLSQGVVALNAEGGIVALLSADGEALEIVGAAGYPDDVLRQFSRFPISFPGPLSDAARTGRPVWIGSREEAARRYPHLVEAHTSTTLHAWANLPLIVDARVVGALEISFGGPRGFDDDREFLLTLARQCAQALDRARLYVAEQAARAEAEEAVRVRDIFFSVAAHELRTPLTALMGQAQLLQRRLAREEQVGERHRDSARVVVGQAQRLSLMISALLDITRIDQGRLGLERAPLDLGALVGRIAEEVGPTLVRHRLCYNGPQTPVVVQGDAMRLEQVVQNLVENAVKYSPQGGEVQIDLLAEGESAVLAVSDEGIGIAEAALPQLFQRFYRAPNATVQHLAGMGVGLYIVREIVTLHGGSIGVTSAEGQGSTFTVRLPLQRA